MLRSSRKKLAIASLPAVAVLGLAACAPVLQAEQTPPQNRIASHSEAKAVRQPNILFVLVDDLGARDLGYEGARLNESPNIDAFARSSAQFDAAYSPSPVCSPSRAAILTGKDPARLGITTWIPGGEYQNMPMVEPQIPAHLPLAEVTIAEVLKNAGYRTFFAGKWHLGGQGFLPSDQGFDVNLGGGEYGQPPNGYYAPYKNEYLSDGPKGEYLENRLTDETIKFMESAKDGGKPFFAFLSFYAVHTPIQASPDGSLDYFKRKAAALAQNDEPLERQEGIGRTKLIQDNPVYASMVHAMDGNFGRVLATLDRLDLRKDTIVVFTSDNGGLSTLDPEISLYEKGTPTSNEPLRAGKGWTYEGGIRVPLLIGGPGIGHRTFEAPVVLTDLFSTLLDLAGVAQPVAGDGTSLKSLIDGHTLPSERTMFWHYPHYHGSGSKPASAIRRGEWKLVRNYEADRWELYDLRSDPGEKHDLSAQEPRRLETMKQDYWRMVAATGAKLPTRRDGISEGNR